MEKGRGGVKPKDSQPLYNYTPKAQKLIPGPDYPSPAELRQQATAEQARIKAIRGGMKPVGGRAGS